MIPGRTLPDSQVSSLTQCRSTASPAEGKSKTPGRALGQAARISAYRLRRRQRRGRCAQAAPDQARSAAQAPADARCSGRGRYRVLGAAYRAAQPAACRPARTAAALRPALPDRPGRTTREGATPCQFDANEAISGHSVKVASWSVATSQSHRRSTPVCDSSTKVHSPANGGCDDINKRGHTPAHADSVSQRGLNLGG